MLELIVIRHTYVNIPELAENKHICRCLEPVTIRRIYVNSLPQMGTLSSHITPLFVLLEGILIKFTRPSLRKKHWECGCYGQTLCARNILKYIKSYLTDGRMHTNILFFTK